MFGVGDWARLRERSMCGAMVRIRGVMGGSGAWKGIIVTDGGGESGTRDVVLRFACRWPVR